MRLLFMRCATAWEWQIGPVYGGINYPRFWRTSGLLYGGKLFRIERE